MRPGETSVVPVIKRISTDPPADLVAKGVPGPVAEVVNKALSKNPADRYPNMQAFARALQQAEVALGLPVTDLTVMTPTTQLPTAWGAAPVMPASPVAPATMAPGGPPPGAAGRHPPRDRPLAGPRVAGRPAADPRADPRPQPAHPPSHASRCSSASAWRRSWC